MRLNRIRLGWPQVLLAFYLLLAIASQLYLSSVQVLFPELKELLTPGNTETFVGRLGLALFLPWTFLWYALGFVWPYLVILYGFWTITRAWKASFLKSLRWTLLLRIPINIILYVSAFAVILGKSEELRRFVNPSGEINLTITAITSIFILLNAVANKLEESTSSKTSLSTENK